MNVNGSNGGSTGSGGAGSTASGGSGGSTGSGSGSTGSGGAGSTASGGSGGSTGSGSPTAPATATATTPANPGNQTVVGTGGNNVSNPANPNIAANTPGSSNISPAISSQAFQIQQRLGSAQTAYEAASAKLAQAQTATPTASADTVRYARKPQDIASCGCVNPDTASSGNADLAAAQAEEAAAATELSNAKAEARQFLDAVKDNPSLQAGNATTYNPLW
jgi:hypothetical protein